jgi:hypothetical protein
MDETVFRQGLAAKIDVSVNLERSSAIAIWISCYPHRAGRIPAVIVADAFYRTRMGSLGFGSIEPDGARKRWKVSWPRI